MLGIREYAVLAFIAFCVFTIGNYEMTIKDLQVDVANQRTELYVCKANKDTLADTVDGLNFEIEEYKVWDTEADKKIKDWQNQPKEVKYVTVYKTIKDVNLSSEECEDVKAVNSAFKSISYSDL